MTVNIYTVITSRIERKTYRKYGNSRAWKEYIKTIEKTIE